MVVSLDIERFFEKLDTPRFKDYTFPDSHSKILIYQF